ncbi:Bicyclogermacrene synthase [Bienertia sinuspersici]
MFLERANLMEEDDFRLGLLSDSMNPKKVLKIARDMKEEGNSFFRLWKVEDALEIYGYAETILVKSKFEEEVDKIEISLKEFEQVGQYCTTILDSSQNMSKRCIEGPWPL